jgi:hypothetical protein
MTNRQSASRLLFLIPYRPREDMGEDSPRLEQGRFASLRPSLANRHIPGIWLIQPSLSRNLKPRGDL